MSSEAPPGLYPFDLVITDESRRRLLGEWSQYTLPSYRKWVFLFLVLFTGR
ncbi:MAG: hypothetical protein QXP97_06470 [Desulfurococcus sp.]|uniref:hypothetical protein n=1 Tax=Desulfurococcus sp. TaxID=51678 RepID=UPI003164EC50